MTPATLRIVASPNEIDILLADGLIEARHIDEPILATHEGRGETSYVLSDVTVYLRDRDPE